jgi:hypothetical protein
MPNEPMPLDITGVVGQVHGYLQMLETEDKKVFKKNWKNRYIVADDRCIVVFRDEKDFKQHAYQRAALCCHLNDLEFFVPSFRDESISEMLRRVTESNRDDAAGLEYLQQMTAITQSYATDSRFFYFGFMAKQPAGASAAHPKNPQLIFRTMSSQEHSDWVHFLARCFNKKLYREQFGHLLPDALFGLICKETQTDGGETPANAEVQTDASLEIAIEEPFDMEAGMSPPPPPPTGSPRNGALRSGVTVESEAEREVQSFDSEVDFRVNAVPEQTKTRADTVEVRWSNLQITLEDAAVQTDVETGLDTTERPAAATDRMVSPLVVSREDETIRLREQLATLRATVDYLEGYSKSLAKERDDAMDHVVTLQQAIAITEGEVKRLRQTVTETQQKALQTLHEGMEQWQRPNESPDKYDSIVSELEKKNRALEAMIERQKEEFHQHIQRLAKKAAGDLDAMHEQIVTFGSANAELSPIPPADDISTESSISRLDEYGSQEYLAMLLVAQREDCAQLDFKLVVDLRHGSLEHTERIDDVAAFRKGKEWIMHLNCLRDDLVVRFIASIEQEGPSTVDKDDLRLQRPISRRPAAYEDSRAAIQHLKEVSHAALASRVALPRDLNRVQHRVAHETKYDTPWRL